MTRGKTVQLYYDDGDRRDRYGRALAQVWTLGKDGNREKWLQEAMVKAGFARVYGWGNFEKISNNLYDSERAAREKKPEYGRAHGPKGFMISENLIQTRWRNMWTVSKS